MQFQQSPYSDHQNQYDISSVNASVNNDNKAAFPSPITTSSLDSPPNNKVNPYMPLPPNSPKSYNNRLQRQQYDMSSYMHHNPSNFSQPISVPNNDNNKSPTSPHQQYYGSSSVPDNSDTLVSPTSPGSLEEEIVQRK
jgi:hypothetical protein